MNQLVPYAFRPHQKVLDLPHYSFMFVKTEKLGRELNNAACSRLGFMLYLGIKKGKEAMNYSDFQQKIGGMDD